MARRSRNATLRAGILENISRRGVAFGFCRGKGKRGVLLFTARGVTLSSRAVPWESLKLKL